LQKTETEIIKNLKYLNDAEMRNGKIQKSSSPIKITFLLGIILLSFPVQKSFSQWKPAENPLYTKWTSEVTPEHVWQEYPRPQLVREKWLNLNGLWDYAIRPKEEGMPDQFDGKILVPFPVESALSGVKKPVGENNRLWYRRFVQIPENWTESRIILRFEASDWETKVWVNGSYVNSHTGGYDHSAFDIAPFLKKGGLQEIVVSVWDPVDSGTQPRGKQVMNPSGIWYTSVTGIWQTVWLEPLQRQYIETYKLITDIDNDSVTIRLNCVNTDKNFMFDAKIFDNQTLISKGNSLSWKPLKLAVPAAKLWSPDSPFLYNLKLFLRDKNGNLVDSVTSYFGMRKISLGQDKDGFTRIMLNNHFVFQFGFLDQGWWPDGLYTAPTDDALRYDIEMTKKMGFNLARKHVKVEPERWYYWCDELGLLVWQDMPSGDAFIGPQDPDIQRTAESGKQFTLEFDELIREKYNHPCIIVWVPFNEGWGQWASFTIGKYIKSQDPTRLVDVASGWTDRLLGDIHDIHVYPGPGMPDPEPSRAIVLGEFGGLGLPLENHTWQSKNNWGYRNLKDTLELADSYTDLVARLFSMKRQGLSAAVYTQTTDVEGEVNGLMTYDRRMTKISPSKLSRINRGFVSPEIVSESNLFLKSLTINVLNNSPSGEIHFTLDDSEPLKTSTLYTETFTLTRSTVVKARIFWPDGTMSKISEARFEKTRPHKASSVSGLATGIGFRYYENQGTRWTKIPSWKSLQPGKDSMAHKIGIPLKKRTDDFGFLFEGYVKLGQEGVYTFYLNSDDGSKLWIDGVQIIDHDGVHGMVEKSGEAALAAGFHKMKVEYFQGTGGSGLSLLLKGPGLKKQEVSSDMLFFRKH
jgi:hypothetical protein